jgi:ariadne-1
MSDGGDYDWDDWNEEEEKIDKPELARQLSDEEKEAISALDLSLIPAPLLVRQVSYDILAIPDLLEKQKAMVSNIADQFDVPFEQANILLRFYQWNTSKLIDDWLANSKKVREAVGVSEPALLNSRIAKFECPLCSDEVDAQDTAVLDCGHRFCLTCWASWLEAETDKGPVALFTRCPAHPCKEIVPDSLQIRLLNEDKKSKYKMWILEGLVQGSKSMKWCPSPKCSRAIEYHSGGGRDIRCNCGHVFCFRCSNEGHRPADCSLVEKWQLKCSTDAENVTWILANTKKCPKCNVAIEKNHGCNHMTCGSCRYEFCWLCKGPWSDHGSATGGYYKCNRYEADKGAAAFAEEAKAEDARSALQKYMFYFTRFDNHDKSIKFAQETRKKAEGIMGKLQDKLGTSYQDVQFVLHAVNAVIEVSRCLTCCLTSISVPSSFEVVLRLWILSRE